MHDLVVWTLFAFSFGIWLCLFPQHLEHLLSKYQVFLFKYFSNVPLFPFKSKEEATVSIFNQRAIRTFGIANFFLVIILLTKISW